MLSWRVSQAWNPHIVITEPRYLKFVTVTSFSPFTLICVDATGVVCHQLGLLGTDLHAVGCEYFAKTLKLILPVLLPLLLSR